MDLRHLLTGSEAYSAAAETSTVVWRRVAPSNSAMLPTGRNGPSIPIRLMLKTQRILTSSGDRSTTTSRRPREALRISALRDQVVSIFVRQEVHARASASKF